MQRFDAKMGEGIKVDMVWIVREPAIGAGYEALVGAYNRALARASREIAVAIRGL